MTVADTPPIDKGSGNPGAASAVPAGAIPAPNTAAIIPGANVSPPEKLFTKPAIEMLDDPPTVSVTTTFTTCGCAAVDAIDNTAVYAPGESPAADPDIVIVPPPVPDMGDTVSQLAARLAGATVNVHRAELLPLKLRANDAGATVPVASAFKFTVVPGGGEEIATGAVGGGTMVALTIDGANAPIPPLSVIPPNAVNEDPAALKHNVPSSHP